MGRSASWMVALTAIGVLASVRASAQQAVRADTSAFARAMDLEALGKYREAVPYYRAAIHASTAVSAVLGLERAYSALGTPDSLLGLLDTLIAIDPKEEVYRTAQLRSLETLGRDADVRRAFDRWARADSGDATPYRTYAQMLMDQNRAAAADSVIAAAGHALGSLRDLEIEVAELHASRGEWIAAATAWRGALAGRPEYADAVAFSLSPTPAAQREEVQGIFLAPPLLPAARRAVAMLDDAWGSATDGWTAIRDLPLDASSVEVWLDFADRAEANSQWSSVRDALLNVLKVRPSTSVAIRAATAALQSGAPAAALDAIPLSTPVVDSAAFGRDCVPIQARALAQLGRPDDAERLVRAFDAWLTPAAHDAITRSIALGWVRKGDLPRARAALAASGPDADSSETAGWLALYADDLKTARVLLRNGSDASPELALALAAIARIHADSAPALASAFLALAVGDSGTAASRFVDAARTPEIASISLSIAAQIRAAQHDDAAAIALWTRIVEQTAQAPEAPLADLEWGRALARGGNAAAAVTRFEHMILTYPESALVPQARRELDVARRAIPPGAAR